MLNELDVSSPPAPWLLLRSGRITNQVEFGSSRDDVSWSCGRPVRLDDVLGGGEVKRVASFVDLRLRDLIDEGSGADSMRVSVVSEAMFCRRDAEASLGEEPRRMWRH